MNTSVRKLTEAAILSAVFIIITMIALGTGIGYGLYLDFGVPIIFALIYFRCDFKYTLMCGISSTALILFVMGNLAAAILVGQSFVIGILCGYLINKKTGIFEDLYLGAILGVLFMVLIDIYARNIIGYSFMEEFQSYIRYLQSQPEFLMNIMPSISQVDLNLVYYLCIATFPFGMVLSIYFVSVMAGKRLRLLKGSGKRKYIMMRTLRSYGGFMNLRENCFYYSLAYVILVNLLNMASIDINNVYLKTIMTCVEYISYYFVFRDAYMLIGNYLRFKFKNKSLNIIYFVVSLTLLCAYFKLTLSVLVIVSIYLDKKFELRNKNEHIVNDYVNQLLEIQKI